MPTKKTTEHARTMKRGPRTKTGDIGAKGLEPIQGKRGTKSAKQAIGGGGIALSKTRRAKEVVAPSKGVAPKVERPPAKRLKAKSSATTTAGKAKPSLKRAARHAVAPRGRTGRHSTRRKATGAAPRSRTKRAATSTGT